MFGCSENKRMENREKKIWWKMALFTVWLRGGGEEKSGAAHKFSLPLQNTISPNWRENWSEKWKKIFVQNYPISFNHFFFFLCNAAFCFLFFFLIYFFFLWVLLLFPPFFFLIFIFIVFLKKKLLDDFLCYFLKCPISSIHKRYDGKFIQTLFSTKSKSFLSLHFSIILTKYKREKLKTFLSSHFSILLLFSIFLLFHTPNKTVSKE